MARPKAVFQPQFMFPIETPADQLVRDLVYSLQADIAETMNTERSQQSSIGISEIGEECPRCLARKLAEIPEPREEDSGWKAQMGTFGHAGLEQHFMEKYGNASAWMPSDFDDSRIPKATDLEPQYHLEANLKLHSYKSLELGGHCDLYIEGETFGVVDDWKFLGSNTLNSTPSHKYQVQMSGYGLAWQALGKLVTHVILYRLPRDGEINEAAPVIWRFNPDLAIDALAKIETLIDAAEIIGWPAVIEAQPRAAFCFSCQRYEKADQENFFSGFATP